MGSIHAKCGLVRTVNGRTVVCGKSKGHADDEHYDLGAEARWRDRYVVEAVGTGRFQVTDRSTSTLMGIYVTRDGALRSARRRNSSVDQG